MAFVTPRTRVKDLRSPTDAIVTTIAPDGTMTFDTYAALSFKGSISTMEDSNNKSFRVSAKHGLIIASDCRMTRISREFEPGSIIATQGGRLVGRTDGDLIYQWEGMPTSMPHLEIPGSNMEQIALAKAYAKMNSSPLMLGEQLNDLNQTIGMLRKPFKSAQQLLSRMAKHARRPSLGRDIRASTKANADAWLEYRYGWTPIILDANEIVKHALKKRAKCDRIRLVSRSQENSTSHLRGSWPATYMPTTEFASAGNVSRKVTVRCSAGVIYDVKSQDAMDSANTFLGTRLRDIPSTLWEITPYSFVVDWFVNIGDWLQAVTPVPGLTVRSSWVTRVQEVAESTSAAFVYPFPPSPSRILSGSYGSSTVTTVTYRRDTDPETTLTPVLTGRSLSVLHQVDAMSLVSQQILHGIKKFRH